MTVEGMPRPGTILDGKYRLVRQLGAGGMGVVYEADHVRLRQPYAIKVLLPELARETEFLRRFDREARAAALLHGPHIVRVFDVDTSPENLTYMVMELLEGQDLAAEALDGRLSVPQLVTWIMQVCSGLQDAHDAGIIHRDLKPANIFLATLANGERVAKVLDFGISKSAATTALSVRTVGPAQALGTPMYMAPEQIRGRQVDARTDVWALGIVLYNLLASRWPFSGQGDQNYMTAVLADTPLPFEIARPDLPYELAAVLMKAIEKDPAHRYQSTAEMAAALAPFGTALAPFTTSSVPRGRLAALDSTPRTVVVPAAMASRSDREGANDTVVDRPAPRDASPPVAAFAPLTPPTPQSTPQSTRGAKSRSTGVIVVAIAACGALAIGALAYASRAPASVGKVAPEGSRDAPAREGASPLPGADPLPPVIELPVAADSHAAASSASAVSSRAAAEPKPSASAPARRRPVHPTTSASTEPPERAPPPANPPLL